MQSTVPRRGSTEYSALEGQCIEGSCADPEILVALRGQGSTDSLDEKRHREASTNPPSAMERDCFRLQNKLLQSKISEEKILRIFTQNEQMLAEKQSFPEQNLLS